MEDLHSFKVTSHQMLINYKEKMNNFIVEQPGRYHLNQVIKVNIISNRTNYDQVLPHRMQ